MVLVLIDLHFKINWNQPSAFQVFSFSLLFIPCPPDSLSPSCFTRFPNNSTSLPFFFFFNLGALLLLWHSLPFKNTTSIVWFTLYLMRGDWGSERSTRKHRYYNGRGLPWWLSSKESAYQCRRCKRRGLDPWSGRISWRRKWQPTPVFLPGIFHWQRSLVGYSPWGQKEPDTTEATQHTHTHGRRQCGVLKGALVSITGELNPQLQYLPDEDMTLLVLSFLSDWTLLKWDT